MKYKFGYTIYCDRVNDDFSVGKAIWSSMVYTSRNRAYNGLRSYLEKNWERIQKFMNGVPKYEIYERAEDFSEKPVDGGLCRNFIEEA